jgi:hypothetical protein
MDSITKITLSAIHLKSTSAALLLGLFLATGFNVRAQQAPAHATATAGAPAPIPTGDLTQAQLVDILAKMGAVVKTEGDAPAGDVISVIFPYSHTKRLTPGGYPVPPYPITDNLVHQISKLPKVTAVEFNMSNGLTEAAIKDIGGMTQLEHLSLNGMRVTDTSMADIAGLTKLNYLRLSGAGAVTAAGWATLENFKGLKTLWVAETSLGDQGIQHFKVLTQLEDITLYGTRVTDAGGDMLLSLPNLKSVRLGPHMTSAETAKLHAALPNCRVFR